MHPNDMREQRKTIVALIKAYDIAYKAIAELIDLADDDSVANNLDEQLLVQVARVLGYSYHNMEEPLRSLFLGDAVGNLFWAEWGADEVTAAFLQGKMVAYEELSGHYARLSESKPEPKSEPMSDYLKLYVADPDTFKEDWLIDIPADLLLRIDRHNWLYKKSADIFSYIDFESLSEAFPIEIGYFESELGLKPENKVIVVNDWLQLEVEGDQVISAKQLIEDTQHSLQAFWTLYLPSVAKLYELDLESLQLAVYLACLHPVAK